MKNLMLFLLLITSFFSLSAQDPVDCITALEVCSQQNLEVHYELPTGLINEEIATLCSYPNLIIEPETNTIWLKYSFISDGNFTFNIIPNNENVDIDFVVFKSPSNDCGALESIRCMFSGENIGQPSSACLGSTGLSLNSNDQSEAPGCQKDDDNYLAPLDVVEGDVIYLMISEFSSTGDHDYIIEHGGIAETNCLPVSISNNIIAENRYRIYPNPFSDILHYENLGKNESSGTVKIYSLTGVLMFSRNITLQGELNLEFLSSGTYFVEFIDKVGTTSSQKIIKF